MNADFMDILLSIFLDILGIVCAGMGESSLLPDFLGLIGLGTPLLLRRKQIPKKIKRRFIFAFFFELLPTGVLPFWTFFSFFKYKNIRK